MNVAANRVRRQFAGFDLSFLTDSTLLTIGIAVARVLGFGFSFILARRLSPDSFGFIQYSITLSGVVAIGTQPFVQHVLARFVGKYQEKDSERLAQTLHAIWVLLLSITALTILIGTPILIVSGNFHIGVLVIFLGSTFFYSYYGLARGFLASRRLAVAYLGSNFVQIIAIFLVYQIGSEQGATPALLIYGLSYLLPVIALQLWRPLPLHFRFKLPDGAILRELVRFSIPVWISHAAFMFYAGMDILLIQRFMDTTSVGLFALTKTLSTLFSFVPMGLVTILLPKVAASAEAEHFSLLKRTLLIALIANGIALLIYALSYRWFVTTLFGPDYLVPVEVMFMLAFAEILFGFHGIITAAVVGGDNPQLETISRIVIVVVAFALGVTLIPRYGLLGAGLMASGSSVVAIITYILVGFWQRSRRKRAPASV